MLFKRRKQTRIGLALGGGGARGLCMIDFFKVLDEFDLKPVVISGTSIGAIMGSFYAAGFSGTRMQDLLDEIGLFEFSKLIDISLFTRKAFLKGKAVREFFQEHIGKELFEQLEIPLYVVATDYWRQEQVVMDRGDLISAVRASMSIPGIFEPVERGTRVLIDGGAVNPLPHEIIRDQCDYLIAIDVSGKIAPVKNKRIPSMFDSVMGTFQTLEHALIQHQLEHSKVDYYIAPDLTNIGILDFHKEKQIRESVEPDLHEFRTRLKSDLL